MSSKHDPATRESLCVVIVASESSDALERCIRSLDSAEQSEVVVVTCRNRIVPTSVPNQVTWIALPEGTSVARGRWVGLEAARANHIVFTEDSCSLGPHWLESWRVAFTDPNFRAASGPVSPSDHLDRLNAAVFLFEYAHFLGDTRRREIPPSRLAGNNFGATRSLLEACCREVVEEYDLPSHVKSPGILWLDDAPVSLVRRYRFAEAIRDRAQLGWSFGRHRAARFGRIPKTLGLVAGPAILAAQFLHLARAIHLSPTARRLTMRGFFPLLMLTTVWSLGEWLGWISALAGRPPCDTRRERADQHVAAVSGTEGTLRAGYEVVRHSA